MNEIQFTNEKVGRDERLLLAFEYIPKRKGRNCWNCWLMRTRETYADEASEKRGMKREKER